MYHHSNRYTRTIMSVLLLVFVGSLLVVSSIIPSSSAALLPTPTPAFPQADQDVLLAASDTDAELQFQCPGAPPLQMEGISNTDTMVANAGQSEADTIAAIAELLNVGNGLSSTLATDLRQQNAIFLPLILRSPDIRFQLITRDGVTAREGRAGTTVIYPLRLVNQGDAIPSVALDFRGRCGGGIPGCIDSYDQATFTNIQPNEGRDFNLVVTIPANAPDGAVGVTEVVASASAALNTMVTQVIDLRTTVSPRPTVTPQPTSTPRNDDDAPDISIQITPSFAEVVAGGNRIYEVRIRNTGRQASTRIELEIPLDRDLVRLLDTSLPGNDNGDWVRDAGDSSGVIRVRFNNLRRNQERRYQLCFQTFQSRPGTYTERGSYNWTERNGDDRRTNRFTLQILNQQAALAEERRVVWTWLEPDGVNGASGIDRRFSGGSFQPGEAVNLWLAGREGVVPLARALVARDSGQVEIDLMNLDLPAGSAYLLAYGAESSQVSVVEIE